MARILITGNQGFFGSRFERFFEREHEILGVDKADMDIVERSAVNEVMEKFRPDVVIHGAAITATDFSNRYPELTQRINVDGAVNVGEAAAAVGARLIFFSTEQVFNGNPESGPYNEDHTPVPNTMYGKTKLLAEQLLRERVRDLWILRFTWMFGMPEFRLMVNPNVVWDALRIAVSGTRTKIPTNEYRGLTWVYHMLERIMGVLDLPCDTYHIGSMNDLSRYEVFCHIFRELGLSRRVDELLEPDTEKYRDAPRDVRLNTAKLAAAGIIFPDTEKSINECLRAFQLAHIGEL